VSWPVDRQKLDRFHDLLKDAGLDAVVVRAPDNVLYLTNYWSMKGYDVAVFPAAGDPTLIVLEPQLDDAARCGWTSDIRLFSGYDPADPRPPWYRSLDVCLKVLRERDLTGHVGLELSQGTQSADRMVGEPTVYSKPWFDAFASACGEVVDASALLARARATKTPQEVERMRLANELAALAMDHVRENIRVGMKTSEVGALYEGFVHSVGVGYQGRVEMARAFTLVWSGPTIRTFTATTDGPVQADEPTLLEIWVCADGYWTDLTKNPGLRRLHQRAARRLRTRRRASAPGRQPGRARPPDPRRAGGDRISGTAIAPGGTRRRRKGTRAAIRPPGRGRRHGGGHGPRCRARRLLEGGRRAAGRGQLPDHTIR
jgi:Xaa-Pro aminopeptidase